MDQIFRIGEFSKLTQVPVCMLYCYGQEGLLKPEQTDPFVDYRLYSMDQIPSLSRILFLRDLGSDVSCIREVLGRWDQAFISDPLEQKRLETQDRIRTEQTELLDTEQTERGLFKNIISMNHDVSIKTILRRGVLSLRRTMPDYHREGTLQEETSLYTRKHDISTPDHTSTIYHDMDCREWDVDTEICASVSELGEDGEGLAYRMVKAVSRMAGTIVCGPFESISGTYHGLVPQVQKHDQYRMTGQSRQTVHREPQNEADLQDCLIEIQIPPEKR